MPKYEKSMQVAVNQAESSRPASSQELLLQQAIKRLERDPGGRLAVHLSLSKLRPANRQGHHLRIAHNTFDDQVRNLDGQLFLLSNGDVVFVVKADGDMDAVDEGVLKVRTLFGDDPLMQLDEDPAAGEFCTWYDLEQDFEGFAKLGDELVAQYKLRRQRGGGRPQKQMKPLTPVMLANIEKALAQADLSSLTRQQPICAIKAGAGEAPVAVMKEFYVSIPDLRGQIANDIDLTGDRWLFQRLTQTLDRRVLSQFGRLEKGDTWRYFSLNLNVATVLAPEFLKFDASLRSGARGTIAIELPPADVFSDISAFMFARDFLQARGYRVCLDGLTHHIAPMIDRPRLGVDLLKLQWDPELGEGSNASHKKELAEFVKKAGAPRVILCRCDDQRAVDYGTELGIFMFQGRHLDGLVVDKG